MPTYEYRCLKCKKTFDHFQKMTDKPLTRCLHCGGKVDRLIGSGGGFIFKGSGFYSTDYRKKPEVKKEKPAGEAAKTTPAEKKGGASGEK